MSQIIFGPAVTPQLTDLDLNFTELYARTQLLQSTTTAIGFTVTPSAWATLKAIEGPSGSLAFNGTGTIYVSQNLYFSSGAWTYKTTAPGSLYTAGGGIHQWSYAASGTAGAAATLTNAMTLDNNANLMLGQTAVNTGVGWTLQASGAAYVNNNAAATGWAFQTFERSGVSIGSITQSGTTGIAYNTTSDYRLKESVAAISNSGAFFDALHPCTWVWKSDGAPGAGFIAHELQAASPSSVTGAKDAVDADGKPIFQTVGYASPEMIAMLVAEVKSLRARLTAAGIA